MKRIFLSRGSAILSIPKAYLQSCGISHRKALLKFFISLNYTIFSFKGLVMPNSVLYTGEVSRILPQSTDTILAFRSRSCVHPCLSSYFLFLLKPFKPPNSLFTWFSLQFSCLLDIVTKVGYLNERRRCQLLRFRIRISKNAPLYHFLSCPE